MSETESTGLSKAREQDVREELTRLLESPAFRTSKRCREFLEYIIEHTIRGPAGALKERSIGVELFQLSQDFDTGQHTIVRVTANEVRKKLAQHYQTENGSFHPVRIDLPPGSYSAAFRWGAPVVEAPVVETQVAEVPAPESPVGEAAVAELPSAADPHLPVRPNWLTPRLIAATLLVLVLAGAFSVWRWRPVNPASVDAKSPSVSNPGPTQALAVENLRMIAGATVPYVDRGGADVGSGSFLYRGQCARPSVREDLSNPGPGYLPALAEWRLSV